MNATPRPTGRVHGGAAILPIALALLLGCQSGPKAPPPTPPTVAACAVNGLPTPGGANRELKATDTSGDIAEATLVLPSTTTITMTDDLTLVASNVISIDGTITMPTNKAARLTIVSLNSSVRIGPFARIGGGTSTAGVTGDNGGAAQGAGSIRIVAPKGAIMVDGRITGQAGNTGGNGIYTNTSWFGGATTVVGGNGGRGGDVQLCALDAILVKGVIVGGAGGNAGSATVTGKKGLTTATAGTGGFGGNVVFSSPGPAGATQVQIAGTVTAGAGANGGTALATGAGDPSAAVADGGAGGDGGTVTLTGLVVSAAVGAVTSGAGGTGNIATANGAPGTTGRPPTAGSDATARGGNGGKPGAAPTWLDSTNTSWTGSTGKIGSGGAANATAGTGGTATGGGALGGPSGTGSALGGANGATPPATNAAPATNGPNPPVATAPGAGALVSQPGIP